MPFTAFTFGDPHGVEPFIGVGFKGPAFPSGGSGGSAVVPVGAVLQSAVVGTAYSETITATGGTGPYTYAVTSGALPAGLTMSSAGVISGTPTTAGTASFTVTATDSLSATGSTAFQIIVTVVAGGNFAFFG